jgi:peptide/nickel transport system substrate-binding protein
MKKLNFKTSLVLLFALTFLVGTVFVPGLAADKDKIVVGVSSPPETMNPHGDDSDANLGVMADIYEGLVKRVGAEGEIKPALATKWEKVSPKKWRFWLREGVTFHNGNEFTWEDVKFTFEHLANNKVSDFTSFGKAIESIETVDGDPWVIDITTTRPIPYFLSNMHQIFVLDKESTESRTPGEVAAKGIGTGPYKFVDWQEGSLLKLEAYEDYWGEVPPIKTAILKPVVESSTRLAALLTGKIDIMFGVPVQLYQSIKTNPKLETITRPSRRSIFLGINNSEDLPTSSHKVRKAMYMAINEQEIIKTLMRGHAEPAAQIPDPPTFGYNPDLKRMDYNPEKAKELLKEAGYEDGFSITLWCTTDRYIQDEQIGQAVVKYLQKVGIDAELNAIPKAMYWGKLKEKEPNFYMLGWFDGAFSFTRSALKLLHTPNADKGYGVWNGAGFSYPKVDKLLEQSIDMSDEEKRLETLQKVNRMYMENVAVIPLHYQQQIYAVRKEADVNFTPRPDKWPVFWEMSFK